MESIKPCSFCVDLTLQNQDMAQELIRLRKTDAILRRVNGVLRRKVTALQDQADAVFAALCEFQDEQKLQDDLDLVSE